MHLTNRLLFSLLVLLLISGCKKKDENPVDTPLPNESEVLVKYMEANGDYINTIAPALISAQQVREDQLNKVPLLIFDLRADCDFYTKGHIEDAVLIKLKDIPWYYRNHDGANKKVVVVCGTGEHASYAVALLRYYGYNNVYGMMWGMSAWNSKCDVWSSHVGDACAANFETATYNKNAAGNLPVLNTGKVNAADILSERVKLCLNEGFEEASMHSETVINYPSDYYVINYSTLENYLKGHLSKSVQYTPQEDLRFSDYLKTLPTDKIIAVYCFTGQTSAHVVAYLRLLGYKAKTILSGTNGMNYTAMSGKKFTAADINDFPVIH